MTQGCVRVVATTLTVWLVSVGAFAQGSSTASISGVVVDADGGVVPGADVVVKNNGTAETFTTVTSGQGVFSIPSLITGPLVRRCLVCGSEHPVRRSRQTYAGDEAASRGNFRSVGVESQH
jgi:hypothetical protein